MNLPAFLRAAPRGLTVAVAICLAILGGLGVWQLQRLHWKESLIAAMARTQALPPAPVAAVITTAQPAWRSVILPACPLHPDRLVYMHSQADGQPGMRILTACPTPGGAFLVDLGFVAQGAAQDFGRNLPPVLQPVGRLRPLDKVGLFAPPNNPAAHDWYSRSAADMSTPLKTPLRNDYFLVLDLAESNLALNGLQQGQLTATLTNRHLEYALTWFGLALTLVGVYIGFVRQRMPK